MSDINKILIIGANSAIAKEVARVYALKKCESTLLGRSKEKLEDLQKDLTARGASVVQFYVSDLADRAEVEKLSAQVFSEENEYDLVLVAYGVLGNHREDIKDTTKLAAVIETNFVSAVIWCEGAANHLEALGKGTLAVIGSVAGDRGRKSNYIYSSAKAGLEVYLQGLRHRFSAGNVNILTIKPGFIDTPMTKEFDKSGPLWATPQRVAGDIVNAISKKKQVLYTPWFWRYIMLTIRNLPQSIFNRMNF